MAKTTFNLSEDSIEKIVNRFGSKEDEKEKLKYQLKQITFKVVVE